MADHKPTQRRTPRKRRMVLGYTRTGKTVQRPSHAAPDMNDDSLYLHVVDRFDDWTRGDHLDAWRIFAEHGEREPDREIGSWCAGWGDIHRSLGRR